MTGCGRYGDPLPPDAYAPQAVQNLKVQADIAGVTFYWEGSRNDLRSKELTEIDGYELVRKEIKTDADIIDDDLDFDRIVFVEDTQVVDRDKLRDEARAAGKPAKRIDVDAEQLKFSAEDNTVEARREYVYKIVPIYQGDVEGEASQLVRLLFNGQNTQVMIIALNNLQLEDEL